MRREREQAPRSSSSRQRREACTLAAGDDASCSGERLSVDRSKRHVKSSALGLTVTAPRPIMGTTVGRPVTLPRVVDPRDAQRCDRDNRDVRELQHRARQPWRREPPRASDPACEEGERRGLRADNTREHSLAGGAIRPEIHTRGAPAREKHLDRLQQRQRGRLPQDSAHRVRLGERCEDARHHRRHDLNEPRRRNGRPRFPWSNLGIATESAAPSGSPTTTSWSPIVTPIAASAAEPRSGAGGVMSRRWIARLLLEGCVGCSVRRSRIA